MSASATRDPAVSLRDLANAWQPIVALLRADGFAAGLEYIGCGYVLSVNDRGVVIRVGSDVDHDDPTTLGLSRQPVLGGQAHPEGDWERFAPLTDVVVDPTRPWSVRNGVEALLSEALSLRADDWQAV